MNTKLLFLQIWCIWDEESFAVHKIMSLYCELETKIHINVMSYALYSYSF